MDAEIKNQIFKMQTQIEEIHAALFAGEVTLNRKPGRLALRLKAKKMLEGQKVKAIGKKNPARAGRRIS
jgi:hypothetical protein